MERIAAIQGGEATPLSSEDALRICREAPSAWEPEANFRDPTELSAGQRVTVRALDYGCDPVTGTVVHATAQDITVRREDPRAGVVYVHFPRIEYEVGPVSAGASLPLD
jgi:hypothetical protein